MSLIYVTGHRSPDTDSIASAIGYAELKSRLDPENEYVPVRLGELNAQTEWALERSGAETPDFLPHVMLRACDVMDERFPVADRRKPVREVGLAMARDNLDLMPIVDEDGVMVGVVTMRALARRYIRESREPSSLGDTGTTVEAIVEVLEGELVAGEAQAISGRVWVSSSATGPGPTPIAAGDVVVVGNRVDAQEHVIEAGAAVLVSPNGLTPPAELLELAREHGTTVVVSPLDAYVSARMITLAAPCEALMESDPLTVSPDDVLAEISDQIKNVHYGAAVAVDGERRPVGLITRSDLVSPTPRRVMLVDHAELAQSVPGADQAQIVEILDHHHIGSIETHVPVTATFDPVGSTGTLVIERFRLNGLEPRRPTAMLLLAAILSDTVILNSPTTTERDSAAVEHLERVLSLEAPDFGRRMFEETSEVSQLDAEQIVARDAKEYKVAGGRTICIAQIETVGKALLERRHELVEAMEDARDSGGHLLFALMVTDIVTEGSDLLVAGDRGLVERAFGQSTDNGSLELPGVMSRKKQVAPKLLAAL
ncbi:MAG TPA: putative manganese-dependent inorganic diphosphatase [Thermoleophilaceae bacterium]|nr:putative manganese-dependent inorganic diphosphatase [Thermoleophilaceae bacterium]